MVATVLTVYGIETALEINGKYGALRFVLQQYLPFTVLKLFTTIKYRFTHFKLQQYLPFTVLKLICHKTKLVNLVALQQYLPFTVLKRGVI